MPYRAARKYGRYGAYLAREFRWPLAILVTLVLAGGGLIWLAEERMPYGRACYTAYMLIFFEPTIDFPSKWYAQALFFLFPILGIGAVAEAIVRLGYLVFSSKRKLQEWWIMEAAAYSDHIVLCGMGRVGYRIAGELMALKEPFVVVERNKESLFAEEMQDQNIPVIIGEARNKKTLERANVAGARAIILATDDDLANLDAALTAREIKPEIRVVMRLFDDTLANKVATTFKLGAISTSQVSAPAFVAAATGRAVLHTFQIEGKTVHVADLKVDRLAGRSVADVQKAFGVSVVVHKGALAPDAARPLQSGDTVVVAAPAEKIRAVEAANRA